METRNKLNYIYFIKFLCAVIIAIFHHWSAHFITNLGYTNIFTNKILVFLTIKSYIFVELFFIMSGILYYINSNDKIKNNVITFKDFIIKKMSRLLPVIIASTIFMFICDVGLSLLGKNPWSCHSTSIFDLFINFFSGRVVISNSNVLNGNIWYINVIFLCFIIAYFLSKKTKKYGDYVFLIPIIISLILYYNFMEVLPIFNLWIVRGLSAFFIGVYTGKFLLLFNEYSDLKKELIKIVCLLLLVLYLVIAYFDKVGIFYTPETFSYSLFVFAPLIIFLYNFKLLNKLFSYKIFIFLGDISYSIYIWNMPILIILHILYKAHILHINIFSYQFFILLFIIHIVVAIFSYIFIEKKFKNCKFSFLTKLFE